MLSNVLRIYKNLSVFKTMPARKLITLTNVQTPYLNLSNKQSLLPLANKRYST